MTITDRLKDRPVYQGLPVPYMVLVVKGVPDFKATDLKRWQECVQRKLCAICGQGLDYWVWYIGGPSCTDNGIYFDLAMHEECAFFSAATCPFLAKGKNYATHIKKPEGYVLQVHHDVVRGEKLYATKRRRDQLQIQRVNGQLCVKTGPEVERIEL
jgi:hypothetical protein